jgi:AcrR family transcriptional regulator
VGRHRLGILRGHPDCHVVADRVEVELAARAGDVAVDADGEAVDAAAEVPPGTTSNYFRNRDDLLTQAGGRIYERLQPDQATIARSLEGPRTRKRVEALMNELVDRITAYRTGYLALLELRLEATRRPELRKVLTERIREDLDDNIRYHLDSGLPGDATTVQLLYLSMSWLIVDRLTLPDVFTEDETRALVTAAVRRLVPE